MSRCLQLAGLGAGKVSPNPMVGALLVYENMIIGEGYHQQFGGPHAEVNCINSVEDHYKHLISSSTLYVSLEPCAHFGKTPPCTDLIISHNIKIVVVACKDPFAQVDGSGIKKLQDAGITVVESVLEKEAMTINRHFFFYHTFKKPFITLKWAQSADGFIAGKNYKRISISNPITNRWVHRLRTTHAAIMVGFRTALFDNPSLTARYWPGNHPLRIVIDKQLQLATDSKLLSDGLPTVILNELEEKMKGEVEYHLLEKNTSLIPQLMELLYKKGVQSLLVEGGTQLLQSFINEDCWNEAYQVKNNSTLIGDGIPAPSLKFAIKNRFQFLNDEISIFKKD